MAAEPGSQQAYLQDSPESPGGLEAYSTYLQDLLGLEAQDY